MDIIPKDNAKGRLFNSFLELIQKKPYPRIKVSELIEKAQVNRSTFYRYYCDIYDYYDRICNMGLDYITGLTDEFNNLNGFTERLDGVYTLITGRISELCEIIKILTGKNGSIVFLKNFRGFLIERLEQVLKPNDEIEMDFIRFYAERIYVYLLCTALSDCVIPDVECGGLEYDPKKGLIENIIELMSRGNGGSFNRLMLAAANVFLTKEPRSLNVNSITKNADICRTEFYNYFGSMKKLIEYSLGTANVVCTQEIFALTVCDENEFFELLSKTDFADIVKDDNAIALVRKHREYYIFVKSNYEYLYDFLKQKAYANSIELNEKKYKLLEFYCSFVVIGLIAYGDGLPEDEFKRRIMFGRKLLEENGIRLQM